VHQWGAADAPLLVMLHGWMDVAASFQFVVDALAGNWRVVAPDARGFGQSGWPVQEAGGGYYSFPEYLSDLDAVLDAYAPAGPVNLIGHSMGANVACLYAGVRPERVRRVVDLEGFGMADRPASGAPEQLRAWLAEMREPPSMTTYEALDGVVARLRKNNPRLTTERAVFLAQHWSRRRADGRYEILGDPAHKMRSPRPYRLDEVAACWAAVTAPVLHVEGSASTTLGWLAGEQDLAAFRARFSAFRDWREVCIDAAGHMLHHDQPEQVAALIEQFCA
jgi:pimeloyl-ACP methyl ester carboxylesterase